jgi:hypothetical protein
MKDEKNFDSIKNVDEVFQCIMVCQDCICITDDGKLSYSGSSVDEICLLEMVKEVVLDANNIPIIEKRSRGVRFLLLTSLDLEAQPKRVAV